MSSFTSNYVISRLCEILRQSVLSDFETFPCLLDDVIKFYTPADTHILIDFVDKKNEKLAKQN